jgi:heterodisulfide reductase subunit C
VMTLGLLSNKEKKHVAVAEQCIQCGKCSSGCPSARDLDLRPRKIALMAQQDRLKELLGKDVIWSCAQCYQCMERCPREITPFDIIIYLQNLSVFMGYSYPKEFDMLLNSVKRCGSIQSPQEVFDKEFETFDRDSLNLPPMNSPEDMNAFNTALDKVMKEAHP